MSITLTTSEEEENVFDEVVSFLEQPATYNGSLATNAGLDINTGLATTAGLDINAGLASVKVIKTHGSMVFLGKNFVYKIKRPVTYDYMDFSTLAKRKANCEREFAINKSIARDLYLAVCPITREKDGQLAIDGQGPPVEWAVKMKRFPQQAILNNIALHHHFDHKMAHLVGQKIAHYHKQLKPVDKLDGALRIFEVIQGLERSFLSIKGPLASEPIDEFLDQLQTSFSEVQSELDQRGISGFIRRCHGDLHLNNIVMIEGEPTPFDALEFDERLAVIDVVYDLGFLLMDLLHLGLKQQANIVLNRYVLEAWSLMAMGGIKVLPLFISLRAAIRAIVSAHTIERTATDKITTEKGANFSSPDIKNYLELASHALKKTQPVLVAIGGLSGTGKSTLAAALAPEFSHPLGAVLLRSDLERKSMLGVPEFKHLSKDYYTNNMSALVYERLFSKAAKILSQGQSVLVDAVFLSELERTKLRELARSLHVAFCGVYLDAPLPLLLERVNKRNNDASDAGCDVVKKQYDRRQQSLDKDDEFWISIDASGSPQQSLNNTISALKRKNLL